MFGKTPTCSFPQFRICGPAPHSESLFRLYFCRVANDATAFGKPYDTECTAKRCIPYGIAYRSRKKTCKDYYKYTIDEAKSQVQNNSSFFVCRIFYPVADKKDLILSFLFALYMANAKAIIRIYASVTLNVIFF